MFKVSRNAGTKSLKPETSHMRPEARAGKLRGMERQGDWLRSAVPVPGTNVHEQTSEMASDGHADRSRGCRRDYGCSGPRWNQAEDVYDFRYWTPSGHDILDQLIYTSHT